MASGSSHYKRKLRGWLSYAFASEVFVIVSLTLFLPICLEQFARDNGYLLPDKTEPCAPKIISNPNPTSASPVPAGRCVVKLGWGWIDTASFSLYVYSISVALQALTVISMGGVADHPPHRKRLLLGFAFLGAVSATLFLLLPSTSPAWFLSAPLSMFANVGFGASVVAMNAYLPSLAKESPEVQAILHEIEAKQSDVSIANVDATPAEASARDSAGSDSPSSPLLTQTYIPASSTEMDTLKAQYNTTLSRMTSRISSLGIASGYIAGIFLLIVALIPVTLLKGSTWALRLAIGLSGIWWGVFTIPAAIWLPSTETSRKLGQAQIAEWEDDREVESTAMSRGGEWSTTKEIVGAWKRLVNMLRWTEIKRLRNTFKYLAAWFLLSDGFTTITSTALLFGKTTLNMPPSSLILIGILTPLSGILGSLLWPVLQRRLGWSNLKVLLILVVMASMIPAYGCLGFLSFFRDNTTGQDAREPEVGVQKLRFGGLTTPGEMYALAVFFGSVYGAFQGYARAFYAELLPPGEEARWYGLFSITDKSSSFIGPLVVGLIADTTGNIRYAFFFLVAMIWVAAPILGAVDVERGREDARGYVYREGYGEEER